MSKPTPPALPDLIHDFVNSQGYPFQEAIRRRCNGLEIRGGSNRGAFMVAGRELPVQLSGVDLHIDGLLVFVGEQADLPQLFCSMECKRVNAAYSAWVFARSGVTNSGPIVDVFARRPGMDPNFMMRASRLDPMDLPVADTAMSLRTQESDPKKRLGDGFVKALTQAWRGANGYAPELAGFFGTGGGTRSWRIQPVIVTTAPLLLLKKDLDAADSATGTLDDTSFESVESLWYESNLSRSMMLASGKRKPPDTPLVLGDLVRQRHQRSVLVTTPAGLDSALTVLAQQGVYPLE